MVSKNAPAVPRRRYADFCNKIGTKRTWRDVRLESDFGGKAEVGLTGRQACFDAKQTSNVLIKETILEHGLVGAPALIE